jgi:hypothetical protein
MPVEYRYVGGSLDGHSMTTPSVLAPGTLVTVPLTGDGSKAELYTLGADRRLLFACYAWLAAHGSSPVQVAPPDDGNVHALVSQIETLLVALDATFAKTGYPQRLDFANWVAVPRKLFEASVPGAPSAENSST